MVANEAAADALCHVDAEEQDLLRSPGRPIVLLRKRVLCDVAVEIAPGNPCLGIMLPYTPAPSSADAGGRRHAAGDDQRQPCR